MKEVKKNSIELQLIARGITDESVIRAFCDVDREDFVQHKYRKQAYIDLEIPYYSNNRVFLRSFVLAKIAETSIKLNPKNVLVVGDFLGYTTSIFLKLFGNCSIGVISKQELEDLKKRFSKNISIEYFENICIKKQSKFDFIFFDSGCYKNSTIRKSSNLLTHGGFIIHFSKQSSPEFFTKQFNFIDILINKTTEIESKTLFNTNLLFPRFSLY